MPEQLVRLRFRPQASLDGSVIDVDPEGPNEWSVPRSLLNFHFHEQHERRDDLRYEGDAPQWIQDWSGPIADPREGETT